MRNFAAAFRDGAAMRKDSKKCRIIFPSYLSELFKPLNGFIRNKFDIDCSAIPYEKIDKAKISEISKVFQEPCILIIGYGGEISHEVCYKLGLAHGYKKQVILVRVHELDESSNHYIPNCIRANFIMCLVPENLSQFTVAISNLLEYILKGDLAKILYQKAVSISKSLEKDSGCEIPIINEKLFLKQFSDQKRRKINHSLTLADYLNDQGSLYFELAFLIADDEDRVVQAFYSLWEKARVDPEYAVSENVKPFIQIINQYGERDNIAGNKTV